MFIMSAVCLGNFLTKALRVTAASSDAYNYTWRSLKCQGSVHTTLEESENVAIFLASTLIRHEKLSLNRSNYKTRFVF